MKILETELKIQDRTLKQVSREGRIALYELKNAAGLLYGFELVRIQVHPEETIRGRTYPQREGYPSNEQWGTEAFSFGAKHRDTALETFKTWANKESGKVPETNLGSRESHHA